MNRKYFASIQVLLLAAIVTFYGCGGPEEAQQPEAAPPSDQTAEPIAQETGPVDGDWIIYRLGQDPTTLNPMLDTSDAYCSRLVNDEIIESLLYRNPEDTLLQPRLAVAMPEVSEDHLTYTYTIREDAVFSDGEPVTAEDFQFTFDLIMDPTNETADIRNYYQNIESVTALDERTVQFKCAKPYFKHLEVTGGLWAFPKHIYGTEDIDTHPNKRKPVGSGPWLFEKWDTNQQIVFVRNENYYNPDFRPHVAKRIVKVISDDNAALQVLERQELDIMALTPQQWVTRASRPEFEAKFDKLRYWAPSGYIGGFGYIGWNLRNPKFSDKRVRQAMTMLLDRPLIIETIFEGLPRIQTGPAAQGTVYYDETVEPWPFDPEAAAAKLDEAGWIDTDGDGIRDKDGVAFEYEFTIPSGLPEIERVATEYQAELKRAGIKMSISNLEWATFIDRLVKREFDSVTLSWAIPPDMDLYQIWHSTQAEKGSNYPGYIKPEVDQILEEARTVFDREERAELYKKLHRIVHEDQPYTFLWQTPALVAVDKRFRNVEAYPMGLDSNRWWVPKELQRYN